MQIFSMKSIYLIFLNIFGNIREYSSMWRTSASLCWTTSDRLVCLIIRCCCCFFDLFVIIIIDCCSVNMIWFVLFFYFLLEFIYFFSCSYNLLFCDVLFLCNFWIFLDNFASQVLYFLQEIFIDSHEFL